MPIIHPNILGDDGRGPFPPSSIATMADVRCSDGFSYGSLPVVSSFCTGTGFGLIYNYKKASTMVLFALLCTVLGRAPNTLHEFLAVRGIHLKCAHVCMYEGHGVVTGIPVDIHMWRMFCHLGWTSEMDRYNVEKSTREIESWFPQEYWGEMNELYAGLGQLLQAEKHRGTASAKVRALAKKTKNHDVIRMAETLLSIPEYNK